MTEPQQAVVTATYGHRMQLRLISGGDTVSARIKGRELRPVCGDRVLAKAIDNEPDWLIVDILPRSNELTRPNQRGKTEILAANLDFIAVACAAAPRPDWYIVDRYLCAAELMRLPSAVVFNKADLGTLDPEAEAELAVYRALNYDAIVCSARTALNLDRLEALLEGRVAIIVGQSGVGKSSLINAITRSEQRTASVSAGRGGEGRHTTVNSVMLAQALGGYIVDSPGVRDYAPAIANVAEVEFGFREIHSHGVNCRFANCRHRREPGCAVKAALESGDISERRFESYRRMLLLTEQQGRGRY
ncbi:MAG: ribosome small subunit-dependent GTPase A [Halioglobus sp.]|nr:ribosome small subunit-dependent GTPase A [Halioglobus sp.]